MKTIKKILSFTFFILISIHLLAQTFNDSYVRIENGGFKIANTVFKPLTINYIVSITKNHNDNSYYLSPHWNYSSHHAGDIWGYPNTGGSRYFYSSTDDEGVALQKLNDDMERISEMGFNVVKIYGFEPLFDAITGAIILPTDNYNQYYSLLDQLLSIMALF